MSISATSSTGSTPAPVATSASSKTTAPAKTDATSTTAAASTKDSSTSGPQDTRFNTPMPPQPVSNGLGQTIGQHLNLRA